MAISPSAIEKFAASDSGCQRRYFWSYVLKDWEPQNPGPSTQAGTLTHAQLEGFHKHGTAIDPTAEFIGPAWYDGKVYRFGDEHPKWGNGWKQVPFTFRIGELALKLLEQTPVHPDGLSEHKFRTIVEGIEFSGVVDYLTPDYITDYKTTGSSLEYAATPRKLLNDTQRLVYSAVFPDRRYSRWVTGEWIDLAVQPAERENVASDHERFKLHVLAPAEKMLALAQTPGIDPLSLPLPGKQDKYTGLTKACNAFGKPCPRIGLCFPKKRLRLSLPATLSPDPEGGMTPKSGRLLGSAPVDLPQSKPTFTFPLLDTGKAVPVETTTAFVLAGSGDAALLLSADLIVSTMKTVQSNESLHVPGMLQALAEDCQKLQDLQEAEAAFFPQAIPVPGALHDAVSQDLQNVRTRLSEKGLGPLLTDKGETRTPFSLSGSQADMPNDVPWPGDKKTVKPKYLIENLYIDCMPIVPYPPGESLEYSYEYVAAAGAEVASDMGVASPMLVDFGKGPHLVTAQLIANLSDRSEPIKHLFLETRSAEGRACMQELTSRAKSVVKGCY